MEGVVTDHVGRKLGTGQRSKEAVARTVARYGFQQVLTDPLLQVCAVSICKTPSIFDDETSPSEIYGQIFVHHDRASHVQYLYNRTKEDAEIIFNGDTLTLTSPSDHPAGAVIPLPKDEILVTLNLKDKATGGGRGTVIALHSFILDTEPSEDGYEKVMCYRFSNDVAVVSVSYIVIPAAALARVQVKVSELGTHTKTDTAVVHGSIVARYDDETLDYMIGDTDDENHMLSSNLFKKPSSKPVTVLPQKNIALSRSFVAVPAYASLILELNLVLNGRQFVGQASFFASEESTRTHEISKQGFLLELTVDWIAHNSIEEQRHPSDVVVLVPEVIDRFPSPRGKTYTCHETVYPLMEVHSVLIGHIHGYVSLYGEITVKDRCGEAFVFRRDKNSPLILSSSNRLIPIRDCKYGNPKAYPLIMKFDLKNVEGDIAIKGYIQWYARLFEKGPEPWCDRPLCAVIQGNHSYAAVRYTLVSRPVDASIKVTFFSSRYHSFDALRFRGSLVARYHKYNGSICFQEDLFATTLLELGDFQEVASGEEIELTKSVVGVPPETRLIIEANLTIDWAGCVQGSVEFDTDRDVYVTTTKSIESVGCHLNVEVRFLM